MTTPALAGEPVDIWLKGDNYPDSRIEAGCKMRGGEFIPGESKEVTLEKGAFSIPAGKKRVLNPEGEFVKRTHECKGFITPQGRVDQVIHAVDEFIRHSRGV